MTEDESFALDISNLSGKIKENKKIVVYSILVLILLFSFYLRMVPADQTHLSAMDPYWHYRHAEEILDHGFPGQALKEVGGKQVAWDYLHDAPQGDIAKKELYPYFVAYSYKGIGQFLTSDLLSWHKLTPVIFGVGAVFVMFLLVKQLFGSKAGLASAFLYSLSSPFMMRSIAGFADTDAPLAFFSLLTLFLFIKAWDKEKPKERIYWGISAGVSLGLLGLTWSSGYSYIPNLILGSAVILVGFEMAYSIYKKGKFSSAFKILKNYTRDYLPLLLVFFLVAMSIMFLSFGADDLTTPQREMDIINSPANVFRGAFRIFNLKGAPVTEDTKVRHVYLTVAEMNPTKVREVISRLHIALFALILYLPIAFYLGLWKKMKKLKFHSIFIFLWFIGFLYGSLVANRFIIMLAIPLCILAGISVSSLVSQLKVKKPILSIGIAVGLIFILFAMPNIPHSAGSDQLSPPYVSTGISIPNQAGSSLGQNWLNLFEWMRTETEAPTVSADYTKFEYGDIMASWWDPGHAVTALGERPAVADGSQNFKHVHNLSIVFTTDNENEAYRLLKSYNVTYFFTSSDLINKYGAISFLASSGPNGQGENYPTLSVMQNEVQQTEEGVLLPYYIGQNQKILVNLKNNGEVSATYKQGYQSQEIARVFYVHNDSAYIKHNEGNDTIDALFYIYPGYGSALFLPPRLENNMLTQLHLFEGTNLEHFKLVKNFDDQIKVFKVE
ncbi:MAG: STT3 domain-containing protein [Candidatus Undinarchaeales archaeon]